ncbi:uncharacterized protein B0I36DRAFT_346661 [Microdochium trichocladiopsis]|uniref:Uncharacterized protein n=1 Tax=Microdochium trichocladiopsis TaxID=1682393 RepID=A0A9P9BST1_9PEZI|nr:uncharacterized protein B0I36DRAFT_346661 [Microdochium trichocladiopsis]KAH7034772.1 hypothetical protein B0I36DRAFT_346661 [Microdochium trichocladiopsis]
MESGASRSHLKWFSMQQRSIAMSARLARAQKLQRNAASMSGCPSLWSILGKNNVWVSKLEAKRGAAVCFVPGPDTGNTAHVCALRDRRCGLFAHLVGQRAGLRPVVEPQVDLSRDLNDLQGRIHVRHPSPQDDQMVAMQAIRCAIKENHL